MRDMNPAPTLRTAAAAPFERSRLAQRLRRVLRGEVLFDAFSRGRYATDASIWQVDPVGVVVPADEADVMAAIDLARESRVPILSRGGGTSERGQSVGEALIIDHSRNLNKVIAFDRDAMTVEVQPGIVLDWLNGWLEPHGLCFPVDVATSAQATLGGMAGNNACGARSIVYGSMAHNVRGIDAILSDGTAEYFGPFGADARRPMTSARSGALVSRLFEIGARERDEIGRRWPKAPCPVGGYNLDVFHPQSQRPYTADGSVNLAHLLVGSQGTLACFRRLHLQLARLPAARVLGAVRFASLHAAMDCVQHVVKLAPSAVELFDAGMIELSRVEPALRRALESALDEDRGRAPQAMLLVEFSGDDRDRLLGQLARLVELIGDLGQAGRVIELPDTGREPALREVRRAALRVTMSLKGDGAPVSLIEGCAVPLEHLAEYTARLSEVFARHGTKGVWCGHASVGALHLRPILDLGRSDPAAGAAMLRALADETCALVSELNGAHSGQRDDGPARSDWVAWQFGPRLTRAFEEIKGQFDPLGLMNPGKIVGPSRLDHASLFRMRPGYAARPLDTALDWSAWAARGFASAVEMCNGCGHCRTFDAGTMCPSYRATRDERDVTRGRANTLRLALSGQLGEEALLSQAMHDTMALCVGCKGCKRDCPAGVDMARMKTEFLHHYRERHAPRLRERLVAFLPHYAPWLARVPWLANLRDRLPGAARLSEQLIGLSARRRLPAWRRDVFTGDDARRRSDDGAAVPDCAPDVVLWADTFDNYFEPDNLRAARHVLQAAGYRVHVARAAAGDAQPDRPLCCGRTFLATGMVDAARAEARRTLAALAPWVQRGVAVVGLEPSCLLTMRDEFLVLGLGEAAAALAAQAMLFEEFLAREHQAGRLKLALRALPQRRALLHGHCHQKAFDALAPVRAVLELIPSLRVELIESGCCGMAGAFGYEAEHHEVSMKMGEAELLPAVRAAAPDDLVVADGTSCRCQIAHGAQRQAEHVACVLERALAVPGVGPGPSAGA